jgi:hypothetical protein
MLLVKMVWSVQETIFSKLPVSLNTGIESLPLSYITSFPQQRYASFVKSPQLKNAMHAFTRFLRLPHMFLMRTTSSHPARQPPLSFLQW